MNKLRLFFKTFVSRPTKMQMFEFYAWQPEKTAHFSRRHHWLPREMTSEENFPRSTTNQKHYPQLISMEFPRSFLRRREMSTVFSGCACHSRPKSYCDPFAQHHGSKALADPKPEVANHRLPAFCAVSNMRNTGTKMSNYCACAIFFSQLGRSVPLTKRIANLGTELLYYCTDLPQWQGWLVYPEHLELASNLHFARFSFVSFQAFQSLSPQQDCTSSPR